MSSNLRKKNLPVNIHLQCSICSLAFFSVIHINFTWVITMLSNFTSAFLHFGESGFGGGEISFLSLLLPKYCWIGTWSFLFFRDQHCPVWGGGGWIPSRHGLLWARYIVKNEILNSLSKIEGEKCKFRTIVTLYFTLQLIKLSGMGFNLSRRRLGWMYSLWKHHQPHPFPLSIPRVT